MEPTGWEEGYQSDDQPSTELLSERVADALKTLETRLKHSRSVIVGHNQFLDLLFLYNTFFDDLPAGLDDFLVKIHELFPYILDTKLLAIKDQAIEGEDPLLDLYNRFTSQEMKPSIFWDTAYGYGRNGAAHEAGFDSMSSFR